MIPVSYYAPAEFTAPAFAYAFARGCGGSMTDDLAGDLFLDQIPGLEELTREQASHLPHAPVALFGSPPHWPILRKAMASRRPYYYADHAYFGRRKFYRVTRNAFQHDGRGNARPDRFRAFQRPVQPWRTAGRHILVCPQSDAYFRLHHIDGPTWLDRVTTELRQYTDREIRVRWKTNRLRPIGLDLIDSWAVVVYSSVAALDALIAGVPIVTLAPFAASVRMGLTDLSKIEDPILPDGREPFLWRLAYQQWTLHEIYQGDAWRALREQHAIDLAA